VAHQVAHLGCQVGCRSCNSPVTVTTSGSDNAFVNGQALLRAGDTFAPYVCPVCLTSSPGGTVLQGSSNVFVNGMQLAAVGSICSDGSTIISGSSNVFVGDSVSDAEQQVLNQIRDEAIQRIEAIRSQKPKLPSNAITQEQNKLTNTERAFIAKKHQQGNVDNFYSQSLKTNANNFKHDVNNAPSTVATVLNNSANNSLAVKNNALTYDVLPTANNDLNATDELTQELQESYLYLLKSLYPNDYDYATAGTITKKAAQHLTNMMLAINKCSNNISLFSNAMQLAAVPIIGFYKHINTIKKFADKINVATTNNGLEYKACIYVVTNNQKTNTSFIIDNP